MQRAAVGVSAVRIPRFEWTFEGEPKGICRVGKTERVLRYQIPAYLSMHKADVNTSSRVAPQEYSPVPALISRDGFFVFPRPN